MNEYLDNQAGEYQPESNLDTTTAVIPQQPDNDVTAPSADLPPQTYRVAGFWVRFWAFIIDLIVITGLNAFLWNSWLPASGQAGQLVKEVININSLFLGITGAAYFILMTYYYQQTLGKMIFGIKVVQADGQPLSWTTVVFRELVGRSLSQLLGLYLGYIVCWFNSEKRCAHDYLSDTWVVHENSDTAVGYITIENSQSA